MLLYQKLFLLDIFRAKIQICKYENQLQSGMTLYTTKILPELSIIYKGYTGTVAPKFKSLDFSSNQSMTLKRIFSVKNSI